MGRNEFIEAVRRAVEGSIAAIRSAHPHERVSGYALCTDDDVSSVYHVACTEEWVAQREPRDPDIGVVPVEWEYNEGESKFDAVSLELRARCDAANAAGDFATHVDDAFRDLVRGLELAKASGVFDDDVFLILTSTDPGPAMVELSIDAAHRLNAPETAARWAQALGE